MTVAGIDVGSRTISLVELGPNGKVNSELVDTTHSPLKQCKKVLSGRRPDRIFATGYGRHMLKDNLGAGVLTEIKAFAIGAKSVHSGSGGILDIGGQDVKVIKLDTAGNVIDFEMNDRCAAGTGKFLEVMAKALGFSIEELGVEALRSQKPVSINSMCTVFAESEVVSLVSSGEKRENIAYGIHEAISQRIIAMLNCMRITSEIFFAGGVAQNSCLVHILKERLKTDIFIPDNPQNIGALGAAIQAKNSGS